MNDPRAVLLTLVQAAHAAGAGVVTVPVALLDAALTSPAETPSADLLTVQQAAARLGVKPSWLYRKGKALPFARKLSHRALRFDPAGLERWKAERGRAA